MSHSIARIQNRRSASCQIRSGIFAIAGGSMSIIFIGHVISREQGMLGIDTTSIIIGAKCCCQRQCHHNREFVLEIVSTALKMRDGTTCIHGPPHMTARVPVLQLQAFSHLQDSSSPSAFNVCQPLPCRILGAKSLIVGPGPVVSFQTVIAGRTYG